ncbi:MAG TPA: tripartite tricarboxylate transporter substrate binding protein [Desulfobacterales bacterium]|nr:tripartite tricarboxylate transporter substrate binding protein [Desulfobacterales bacterium]
MRKTSAILFACMVAFGGVLVNPAVAQEKYPKDPITIVVPYAPGGSHDLVARTLQPHLEKLLGVSVLVENKPGGGSTIASNFVKAAPPNGYTLVTVTPTLSIIKYTLPESNVTFDQFEPIAYVGYSPQGVFTRMDAPWNTLKELLDYAKANPEKIKCGNAGHGGNFHMGAVGIEQATGVKFTHIPFKGAAPAVPAVMGGHVDIIVSTLADTLHMVKGGSLKVLGLAAPERNKFAPNAQTFKELGYDIEFSTYWSYLGPKGMPKDRVQILYDAFKKSTETKEVKEFFDMQGAVLSLKNPEELGEYYRKEDVKWGRLIKEGGLMP